MQTQRFKDENLFLWHFDNKVLVHCPKCRNKATVDTCCGVLSCDTCGYHAKKEEKDYYCLEIELNCPQCGKRIEFAIDKVTEKKEKMRVSCPHCGFNHAYKPKYTEHSIVNYKEYRRNYKRPQRNEGEDCVFNADLWLKKPYKNHLFWANNYQHLNYLKRYIQAKVRERNEIFCMSMVAKLPPFIKAKKNRDDLLKIIEGLEKK